MRNHPISTFLTLTLATLVAFTAQAQGSREFSNTRNVPTPVATEPTKRFEFTASQFEQSSGDRQGCDVALESTQTAQLEDIGQTQQGYYAMLALAMLFSSPDSESLSADMCSQNQYDKLGIKADPDLYSPEVSVSIEKKVLGSGLTTFTHVVTIEIEKSKPIYETGPGTIGNPMIIGHRDVTAVELRYVTVFQSSTPGGELKQTLFRVENKNNGILNADDITETWTGDESRFVEAAKFGVLFLESLATKKADPNTSVPAANL